LHDEIAQLSSLEHEQDIVGNTLKGLTKDAYEVIGQQLGFVDGPKPQPTTVEDSKTETMQDRVEAVRDAHNVEVVSSSFTLPIPRLLKIANRKESNRPLHP
jgi:hypothetical protein